MLKYLSFLIAIVSSTNAILAGGYISPTIAYTRGGATVYITTDETIGCYGTCNPPVVLFDGVPSAAVTISGPKQVSAVVPAHPQEGIVQVTIIAGNTTVRMDGRFAYIIDRESILVPVSTDRIVGARGIQWSTELWVHNAGDNDVSLRPKVCGSFLGLFDCGGDPLLVPAHASRKLPGVSSYPEHIGAYYYVPRDSASQVSFDLRLFSGAGGTLAGTSLPVVREAAKRRDRITLLNVPGDNAEARKLLRIYTDGDSTFVVKAFDLETGAQLAAQSLGISFPTDGPGSPSTASNINDSAIFDVPAVQHSRRLRIEIEAISPVYQTFWAFITATNNTTQQVDTFVPQ